MREIHFFENEYEEKNWVKHQGIEGRPVGVFNDFDCMKYTVDHPSQVHEDEVIVTTQMCYLDTRWLEEGFRIFVHDHTGVFEIVIGDGNERTNRFIRYAHNLFRMWENGEFGLKEEE